MENSLGNIIIHGNVKDVAAAIEHGADIFEIDEYGFNPMVETAIMRKTDIARLLLSKGASVDMPDLTGRTALHWACDNEEMELCELLLRSGANPNTYSFMSQPALVYPVLRNNHKLKSLLYKYGAKLTFAQDYINTKLLGHRFALPGKTHIYSPENKLILVDFEGFLFEFTANLIQDSLQRFQNHYLAKHFQHYAKHIKKVIHCMQSSAKLIKHQRYVAKIENHMDEIDALLSEEMVLIPVVYTGHAVTLVKFQDLLVKCDRGAYGRENKTVTFYKMPSEKTFAKAIMRKILYKTNDENYIHYGLNKILDLKEIFSFPIPPQTSGNCSWANVEATIPVMLFLWRFKDTAEYNPKAWASLRKESLYYFQQWQRWDQDRAIDECIQSFYAAELPRQTTKAQVLSTLLVYHCDYKKNEDLIRSEKILQILNTDDFHYLLDSYIKVLKKYPTDPLNINLKQLLDIVNYRY